MYKIESLSSVDSLAIQDHQTAKREKAALTINMYKPVLYYVITKSMHDWSIRYGLLCL